MTLLPNKIVLEGLAQAMSGRELWVNTTTDEPVKILIKDRDLQRHLYCKKLKITIEVIEEFTTLDKDA